MNARKRKRLMVKMAQLSGKYNELDRICALVQDFPSRYIDQRANLKGQIAEIEERLRSLERQNTNRAVKESTL